MEPLILICTTESNRIIITEQLNGLPSIKIPIVSYSLENGDLSAVYNSIVLVDEAALDISQPYLDKSCKVITARRTLDYSRLDKLYSLKKNSRVLLVNDNYVSTMRVIDILERTGFSDFNYIPYYPKCKLESYDFDYIITPGEEALCPKGLAPIINIGSRILDITTIVEILQALDLFDDRVHLISAKYVNKIIAQGIEIHNYAQNINSINDFLHKIINTVDEGILSYNKNGLVTTINTNAKKIIGVDNNENLKDSPSITKEMLSFFLNDNFQDNIYTVSHTEFLFNKILIESTQSYVCTIKNVRERINLENRLRKELKKQGYYAKYSFDHIIHFSPSMAATIEKGKKLARNDYNILILGESGTGKELFASAIHNYSDRRNEPFLAVNFSALPEELIESELFGYEEGAFTGAKKGGKIGLFEMANKGTIFLDEIGDITPKIQLRLLRVIEEKEVLKVGGNTIIPVDVRVIAATNKNLFEQVEKGFFRKDLYYRLKKLYLNLPPLRERKEDILTLFSHFLQKKGDIQLMISPEVEKILLNYNWPGNVRELENAAEYALVICDENNIMPYHLPEDIGHIKNNNYSLDEIEIFILRSIGSYNQQNESIGRKKLSELSTTFGFNLSEQQMRTRIDKLSTKGYIKKNRGRLGLSLTTKGRVIL